MYVTSLSKEFYKIQKVHYKKAICKLLSGKAKPVHNDIIFWTLSEWYDYAKEDQALFSRKIHNHQFEFYMPIEMIYLSHSIYLKSKPFPNRKNVWLRDNKKCVYCGKQLEYSSSTLDHVIPICKGGTNRWRNLVISCKVCNNNKGAKDLEELKVKLKTSLRTPTWIELLSKNNFSFV